MVADFYFLYSIYSFSFAKYFRNCGRKTKLLFWSLELNLKIESDYYFQFAACNVDQRLATQYEEINL